MKSHSGAKAKGWIRDLPDFRDHTPETTHVTDKQAAKGITKPISELLKPVVKTKGKTAKSALPAKVDLRQWCSPIENQGEIGSCTAHAGTALYEYFERKAYGKYVDGSRLFLYKATRNLLGWEGDDGATLRATMGAIALFGIVPEKFWPYKEVKFNEEPSAFLYSFAQSYQAISYYRLDVAGVTKPELLIKIKEHLANSLPLIFGFTCYSSLDIAEKGMIPFPDKKEDTDGGHAIMVVGYDDSKKIVNPGNKKIVTTGAILIRNSWGTDWGEEGYGWLPYEYILRGLAADWWTMTSAEWLNTKQFGV